MMVLTRIISALAIAAAVFTPAAEAQVLNRRPDCLRVAVPVDVSGSMRPYFREAQDALLDLLNSLRPCDSFHIIPFSETKLEGLSRELTPENRASVLAEAEAFVRRIRPGGRKGDAYGHWTNLDEGVDAATLALLREDDRRNAMIVLISDGLSDPDPQHKPVDLAELGRRVPRGALNLYLVDLSGHEIAGLERDQIGPFDVGRVANAPVVVIPLQRVEDLRLLLQELENQGRAEEVQSAQEPPSGGEREEPPVKLRPLRYGLIWLLPLVMAAIIIVAATFLRRRRHTVEEPRRPRRVLIRLDGEERRYGLPATLTIGSGERDDIRVRGAKEG